MPDAHEDLRATSEAIQDDAEELATLEVRKREIEPTDSQVVDLSRRIEELAQEMATKATAERELSEEIQEA
jgi:hypothetical protein